MLAHQDDMRLVENTALGDHDAFRTDLLKQVQGGLEPGVEGAQVAVLAGGSRQFGFYPRLPFYSSMWQDAGFPEAAKGEFSEQMAKALIISGDAETVATRIRDIPNSGADEIIASIVNLDDGGESAKRTLKLLGELARGA